MTDPHPRWKPRTGPMKSEDIKADWAGKHGYEVLTYHAYQDQQKKIGDRLFYYACARFAGWVVCFSGLLLCGFSVLVYWWISG